MNWALTVIGTGILASVALAAANASSHEEATSALQSACLAANGNYPDACPCIADAGRSAGLTDEEMIAVMSGDRDNDRLAPAVRGQFNRARINCVVDAARAKMQQRIDAEATSDAVPYTARPVRPEPQPSDRYIGQAPIKNEEAPD